MKGEWNYKILNVTNEQFPELALEIFRYQSIHCLVYKDYIKALKINPGSISRLEQIPFLPIRLFKSHEIKTGSFVAETVFESSGTTGTLPSRHFIKSTSWYDQVFTRAFEKFYGNAENLCIIGLLPSYLERKSSSLVFMVDRLLQRSGNLHSGFYLYDFDQLMEVLFELEKNNQPALLIGVTFALLDFAERKKLSLRNTVVMETGGMKGRREEMIREEVHEILKEAFGVTKIHSEYGMTELLSQAYSKGGGIYTCPPWMRILLRDDEDPFLIKKEGSGAINIIDLANIHSCCFIATDDAGKLQSNGNFEILGRMDGSDLRGCSLLTV
jgi:phenylacetate-coenzyme A ligase PaaK-like adenylate-forming protein